MIALLAGVLVARLSGVVTDPSTGAPLAGVQVTVGGQTQTTEGDGVYELRDLDAGRERVRFVDGGVVVARDVDLTAGHEAHLDVALDPLQPVVAHIVERAGTASAIAGNGFAGAYVWFGRPDEGTAFDLLADARGYFDTGPIATGTYTVTIDGHTSDPFVVDAGAQVTIVAAGARGVTLDDQPFNVCCGPPIHRSFEDVLAAAAGSNAEPPPPPPPAPPVRRPRPRPRRGHVDIHSTALITIIAGS